MPSNDWFLGNDSSGAVAWGETVAERGLFQSYAIKNNVESSRLLNYAVKASVLRDLTGSFAVRTIVSQVFAGDYLIVGGPSVGLLQSYAVLGQVGRALTGQYEIGSYSGGGTGNNAPTNLSIAINSSNEAILSWTTDIPKDNYRIYVGPTSTGPFDTVATIAGSSTDYTYTGLLPGRQVYLTVSSLLTGQESARYVPALSAIIPPSVDTLGTVTDWPVAVTGQTGPGQLITVTWGSVTRSVTANTSGAYSVTFTEADNLVNGSYTVFVTSSYNTNQNISTSIQVTLDTEIVDPTPVGSSNFFFFFS